VLEKGKVVEKGVHEDLYRKKAVTIKSSTRWRITSISKKSWKQ